MTTAIKSKDLVVPQRGIIKMSCWPTKLYSQQVSDTRGRNGSMARRLNSNLCPSTTVKVLFFFLKPKAVHKICTKLSTIFVYDRNRETGNVEDHVYQVTGKTLLSMISDFLFVRQQGNYLFDIAANSSVDRSCNYFTFHFFSVEKKKAVKYPQNIT